MSISIWIKNDTDKSIVEQFTCLSCEKRNLPPECPLCHGTGEITKARSQYFINLPNSIFYELWIKLGIPCDDGDSSLIGNISSSTLAKALQNCKFKSDQYLPKLNKIAQRALKKGEDIFWG